MDNSHGQRSGLQGQQGKAKIRVQNTVQVRDSQAGRRKLAGAGTAGEFL